MAEKLCDLKTTGGEDWPDMTGATPLTVHSNRITNITKNGMKKINNITYIEFEGDFNFSTTGAVVDVWRLFTDSIDLTGSKIVIESPCLSSPAICYCIYFGDYNRISIVVSGSYNMANLGTQHVRIKIYD